MIERFDATERRLVLCHETTHLRRGEASPSLVKAASDDVMNWRFNPEIKNGKPIAAYTIVPVNFSMHENTPPPALPAPPSPPPLPPAPPSTPSTNI